MPPRYRGAAILAAMLEDFPGSPTPARVPAPPPALDPALLRRRLRLLWWGVPLLLLGEGVFQTAWTFALRASGGGFAPSMVLALVPWAIHVLVVLGVVGWLYSRGPWTPGVQALLLASAALPFLRFVLGRGLAFVGLYGRGGMGFWLFAAVGFALTAALALAAALQRPGETPEGRDAGGLAAGVAASVAGGWAAWALLPLLSRLTGRPFAEEAADAAAPHREPSPVALTTTGWGGLVCVAAALVVPVLGALQVRGMSLGPVFLVDAAFLLLGAVTWAVLGARWARGRTEGRILRVLTWLALALPVLLIAALVVLLLVFKPRLF
ncbi:MAG: hypothetical protein U0P81_08615 [Holophagaceae bacterium]